MSTETTPKPETEQARATLAQRLRSLAAWAVASRLRIALLGGTLVVVIGGTAVVGVLLAVRRPAQEPPATLAMALDALDRGDYAEARLLAERILAQDVPTLDEWGGPVFVLGAAAAHEADQAWEKDRKAKYLVAARYLEDARDRGFPAGREAEGLYLLGKSLSLSGRASAARSALQAALKANPDRASEIHRLSAAAHLGNVVPDLEKALAENRLYLADRNLSAAEHDEGVLQQGKILFGLGRLEECAAGLDKISPESNVRAEATVLRGQVLCQEARRLTARRTATADDQRKAREKLQAAIETFRLAQSRDNASNQATRQAMYLTGVCLVELGDHRAAQEQFGRTSKLFADSPEALASDFQEAELAKTAGRSAEALAAYRRVLRAIPDPENFRNPWLTLGQLRSRLLAVQRQYLDAGEFEPALGIARALYPVFPRAQAMEMTATAHRRWGEALLEKAEKAPPGKADALRHLGRTQFRQAGGAYGRVALLQIATRQYPELVWTSASAYLQGQDYRNAVRMLQKYVENETRGRHAQALTALGEARMALGQPDKALEAFQLCIDFHPRDAAAYRARVAAARAYLEKGDFQKAEAMLKENLGGEHLTPAGKEWRDSLFALGELLHAQGRYPEAIRRLEEAAERYPDAPQSLESCYLLADSLRHAAQALRQQLAKEPSASIRADYAAQAQGSLSKALGEYRRIIDLLDRRDASLLSPRERAVLRNSLFAVGEVCVELEQYAAAAVAYTTVANRSTDRPEVLDAYVRLAEVYRRMDQPVEARSTLEQAKVVLSQLKGDAAFTETTNYNRKQWGELLKWMSGLD
jgi:tetratricopeptide (TPR) repeat protein